MYRNPGSTNLSDGHASHEGYEFKVVANTAIPRFAEAAPIETFSLLCDLLHTAIDSATAGKDETFRSIYLRRRIGTSESFREYDILHILIDSVRDLALSITKDASRLPSIIEILHRHQHELFDRVASFVVSRTPKPPLETLESQLLSKGAFSRWDPEYRDLLREMFERLGNQAKDQILEWISRGPEPSPRAAARQLDDTQVKSWKELRLRPLWKHIAEGRQADFAGLGVQPDDRRDVQPRAVWSGPSSPRTTEELKALDLGSLIEFLRSWEPKAGPVEPTAEGLGSLLARIVGENPGRYAERAKAFIGLEKTYVRSVLQGLSEAARAERQFDWTEVLDLCEFVVTRPTGESGDDATYDHSRDPSWAWSRRIVPGLIKAGLDSKQNAIPFEKREQVWRILEPLTWDSDPDPARDKDRTFENAIDLAINSIRGEAMAAVVRYGVWAKERLGGGEQETFLTNAISEVGRNLIEHLDPTREPSPAIWAVLGESYPVVHWLDSSWATANASAFFPATVADPKYWEAASATYFTYQQPYDTVFQALGPTYQKAITTFLGEQADTSHDSAAAGLGRHLSQLYGRGIAEAEPLLREYFGRAPLALRAFVVDFIGRTLHQPENQQLPLDVRNRLQQLIDWRMELINGGAADVTEVEEFGWWLASGTLDADWAFGKAVRIYELGGRVEPDHLIVEYLTEVAKVRPSDAARLLEAMVDNLKDQWTFHGWSSEGRKVVEALLASQNPDAIASARRTINKLAARGYKSYPDLL